MRSITIITSFILTLSSIFFVGCGAKLPSIKPYKMEIQQGNVVTSKMLLQLRPGMTRSQVRFIMGTPLIVDSFHENRWDYFYQLRQDGRVTEKRRVILDFDKDALVSVRGDVVAAGDKMAEAPINTAPKSVTPPKKEESKSWLDRLKFWESDEEEKQAPVEAAAVVVVPATLEATADKEKSGEGQSVIEATSQEALAAPVEPASENTTESILKKEIEFAPREEAPNEGASGAVVTAIPSEPIVEKEIKAESKSEAANVEVATVNPASAVSNGREHGADELSKQAVLASFDAWANAWRNKDFNQYIGVYAESFKPEGQITRKSWVVQRKDKVANIKGDIKLELEDVDVQVNDNKASVEFFQRYSSKVYSDEVTKRLDFELDANKHRWLIVKESVLTEGRRPAVHKILAPEGTDEHLEGIIERIGF